MEILMIDKKTKRPVLRWHGGKWILAPWIISHFPKHQVYTEVFGGAGSVLIRKKRSYAEVYNDLDGDVVNLFRVLQDERLAKKLIHKLEITPFARDEHKLAHVVTDDSLEKARRLIIRSFMGFGSNGTNAAVNTGFRANSNRSGSTPAHDWNNYPQALNAIVERIKGIIIENRPAVDVLMHQDGKETLHYVDPPYLHGTRCGSTTKPNKGYIFEMTDADHRELADCLHSLEGMVVLSGYSHELYDDELYPDWKKIKKSSLADGAKKRTEVLYLNKAAYDNKPQGDLL